jgi:hypothetical protein
MITIDCYECDPLAAARTAAHNGQAQTVMLFHDHQHAIGAGWVSFTLEDLANPDLLAPGEGLIRIDVRLHKLAHPQTTHVAVPLDRSACYYALGTCLGSALTKAVDLAHPHH